MGNSDQLLLIYVVQLCISQFHLRPAPPLPPGPLRGICPPCQSRGWGICKKRQKGKKVAVLTKNGAFALFFRPHPGGFDSSRVPTPGNLPSKVKKNANARGSARGGGGGWAQVELTDALRRKENEKEKRVVFFFTTFQSNGLHPERLGAFLSCWKYLND